MASADMLKVLYSKKISPLDFKWDTLFAPPLLTLLSVQDIYNLNAIAMSNKLASKPQEKYKMIDSIVTARGFKKIASGTNRITYKYLENQSIAIKIAIDRVGVKDNPAEFINQFKLKPFVTRVFEVSPCGTVGLFERVEPVVTREEFLHISNDVFDLLVEKIIGKYVVQDVGSSFFQNYGIRLGFGPVLLDFPYVYELDGSKMYCNRKDPDTNEYCLGEIDYDIGFNNLICTKCGKLYLAKQLEKQVNDKTIVMTKTKGVNHDMEILLVRGDEVETVIKTSAETTTIIPKKETVDIKIKNLDSFNKNQLKKQEEIKRKYQTETPKVVSQEELNEFTIRETVAPTEPKEVKSAVIVEAVSIEEMERREQNNPKFVNTDIVVKAEVEVRESVSGSNQEDVQDKEFDDRCNTNTSVDDYTPDDIPPKVEDEPVEPEPTEPVKFESDSSWEKPDEIDSFKIENDIEVDDVINEF